MSELVEVHHVGFEDLGIFEPVLRARGFEIHHLQAGVDDLSPVRDADLAIVLGGPIGADEVDLYPWLADELDAVSSRTRALRPTIGICLGAQLMALALGARVVANGTKEIGYAPLTLTAAGERSPLAVLGGSSVLHWHGDRFDVPDGAELLAGSAVCAQQAFSVGKNLLALQFHAEADPHALERWLIGHACELAQVGVDPRALRADAQRFGAELSLRGAQLLNTWLDQLER